MGHERGNRDSAGRLRRRAWNLFGHCWLEVEWQRPRPTWRRWLNASLIAGWLDVVVWVEVLGVPLCWFELSGSKEHLIRSPLGIGVGLLGLSIVLEWQEKAPPVEAEPRLPHDEDHIGLA